ncbi:MAG: porin [Noviherbaspirillum sp.]|jgi:predicted porin|nr:porin [Noviherbaspirillum sp.]
MNKSLLALAVMAACAGTASAQTNVTIYGVVDAGIAYKNDGNPAGKTWALESGQQSGSRLGFKGSEDLGSGLSAIFALENGFSTDTGALGQGNRLFGRQAWVGLTGGFGTVKLGRQPTSLYTALDVIDPFGTNLAGNAQKVFGYGTYAADPLLRTDNTLSYALPRMSGFSGIASYGFGEQAGNFSAGRNLGLGLNYVNGPINVQFAHQHAKSVSLALLAGGTLDTKATLIGATYDFNVAKAHVAFAHNKFEAAGTSDKIRNWLLGVSAPVGAGTLLASYIRNDVTDVSDGKSDQYALGYTHPLSKRTNVYTSASFMKNDDGVALNAAATAPGGASVRLFNVGIRHTF